MTGQGEVEVIKRHSIGAGLIGILMLAGGLPAQAALSGGRVAASGLRQIDPHVSRIHGAPAIEGELIVRFAAAASAADRRDLRASVDASFGHGLGLPGLQLLNLRSGDVRSAIEELSDRPDVLYAEPNYVYEQADIPNDPSFGQLWGLNNTGQTVNGTPGTADADIDAAEAWDTATGSSSVVVAVVDSGVAWDHPDIAPNMWSNAGETPGNGTDDDGNGFVDDVRGWDFIAGDNDPFDLNLHGTHVAATIGAQGDNGTGITGVNWDVSIMALRALNSAGTGTSAAIAAAFTYAGNNGADVVNASLSGGGFSQAMLDAINAAPDTLFVAAAGNERIVTTNNPRYPCNYTPANNICVAATDSKDMLTNFSNRGTTHVDLAAPGVNVLSALPNFESQFSETFSDGPGWTGRWNTGGTNNSWGLQVGALADSPGANYLSNTNSFARKTAGVNTIGQKGCRLDYTLNIDTEHEVDFLHVDASTNGTTFTAADSLTGSTEGFTVDVSSRLGSLDNQATAYFGFRLQTNGMENASGVVIDDIDFMCIEPGYDGTNEYGFLNGTSMSTPHVAGAAALLLDVDPTATVAELRSALLHGVDPKATLAGQIATGGRLNLKNSVDLIAGDNVPPDAVDDSLSTEEGTPETIDVLANDTDPDGDDLTVAVSTDGDDGLVDCTAGGNCTYTPDAGFNGTDDFTYIVSDGNGGSDPATVHVTVAPGGDQTPPNTKINKGPKGKIKKKNAKRVRFRFSSTEAGSTFECKRNKSPWRNCSSPKIYRNLPRGKHIFKVRATDASGNTDPSPAKRRFKIVRNKI